MSDNLFVMTEQEEERHKWNGWEDMPEYVQENDEAYHVMKVRFRNDEDIAEFAKAVGQLHLTKKSKYTWYPREDTTENSLLRWVDEDDAEK
jgi:hypothetical protein